MVLRYLQLGSAQSEIRAHAYGTTLAISYTHVLEATDGMTRYSLCLRRVVVGAEPPGNTNAQQERVATESFDWECRTIAAYFNGAAWTHDPRTTPVVYQRRTGGSTTRPAVSVSGGVRPQSQVSSNQARIYTQMPAPAGGQPSRQFAQNHQPPTPHSVVPYAQSAPRLSTPQRASFTLYTYFFAFPPDASPYAEFRTALNGIQDLTVTSGGRWGYSTLGSGWTVESYVVAVPSNAAQTVISQIRNFLDRSSFRLVETNGHRIWEFSPAEIRNESSIRGARSSTPAASARNPKSAFPCLLYLAGAFPLTYLSPRITEYRQSIVRKTAAKTAVNKRDGLCGLSFFLKSKYLIAVVYSLFICNAMDISDGRSHAKALTVLRTSTYKVLNQPSMPDLSCRPW
jgi:hypothetical protein